MSHHLLTIPAPCDWLRLNGGHGNRYAKAGLIRTWRAAAAWESKRQHLPAQSGLVRIVATVHLATKPSRWDATNWLPTAKACIDGLVDARVLADDSNRHVIGPDMRAGDSWADAALVLTIEQIGDAA
jgi:hypothetical protein